MFQSAFLLFIPTSDLSMYQWKLVKRLLVFFKIKSVVEQLMFHKLNQTWSFIHFVEYSVKYSIIKNLNSTEAALEHWTALRWAELWAASMECPGDEFHPVFTDIPNQNLTEHSRNLHRIQNQLSFLC